MTTTIDRSGFFSPCAEGRHVGCRYLTSRGVRQPDLCACPHHRIPVRDDDPMVAEWHAALDAEIAQNRQEAGLPPLLSGRLPAPGSE